MAASKPLPNAFLGRLRDMMGEADYQTTLQGFSADRVCSFRVNTIKSSVSEVEAWLKEKGIKFQTMSFLPLSYIIDKKDEFILKGSELFYGGKIYMQGIASQIPAILLGVDIKDPKNAKKWWNLRENDAERPLEGQPEWTVQDGTVNEEAEFWTESSHFRAFSVFDVTAAPGSKTTQIAALMNNTGTIIACEKHQIRHDKLGHNLRLQGVINTETHKMDAIKYSEEIGKEKFDAILLDAPCSAEGRIRADDERTFGFWSRNNTLHNAEIQRGLLKSVVPLLKSGGTLVYSTCTLAPEENEEVISWMLETYPELSLEPITIDFEYARKGLAKFRDTTYGPELEKTLRILPSALAEGFFVAKLRKA